MMLKSIAAAALFITTSWAQALEPASQRLDQFMANTQTLSAKFTQVVRDEVGRQIERSEGSLFLARPDRFRWAYQAPERMLVVADGYQVWVYDESLEQVSVALQKRALLGTPAELLATKAPLAERFEIEDIGLSEAYQWVELIPRDPEGEFSHIRLGFGPSTLRQMEIKDLLGNTTRIELNQVQVNQPIDSELFHFEPEDNMDVVAG